MEDVITTKKNFILLIAIIVFIVFIVFSLITLRHPPVDAPLVSIYPPLPGPPYVSDQIMIQQPRPNSFIGNGQLIVGEAVGTWFFEASFPIKLLDTNGNIVASTTAHALDNWMTTKLVRFTATLNFTSFPVKIETWSLVFQKDNPSGLPENDDSIKIPVLVSPPNKAGY